MTDSQISTVTANGIEIAYLSEGDGPLMLCLHGFPDTPHGFNHQLSFFAQQGYRVVAPFLRGYAPTELPRDASYQAAELSRDAIELIGALGHDSAVIYGHDWGCSPAYGAAVLAPERVQKLVTAAVPYGPGMATALMTNPAQQRRSWYMFYFQTMLADFAVPIDDFAFIEQLWHDWSPGGFPAEALAHAKRTLAQPGVLAAALAYYRVALDPTRRRPELDADEQRLGRDPIEVPALYLHGADDGCIGLEVTEGMEALFPGGLQREVLQGAGHFLHMEAPEAFNARVLAFLRD